jgi:hypothetical protein
MTRLSLILIAFETATASQWLNHPAAGIPRLPNGKRICPRPLRACRTASRIFPESGSGRPIHSNICET